MESLFIRTNGITLHVVQDGPKDGPLVILLHGFPEFWYGWRKQIAYLAAQGYCVWAPDQRGYNVSDKPKPMAAYSIDQLANDVIGLIDAAGRQQAHLVGHDWGAAVAWWVAAQCGDRLKSLVILNVPKGEVLFRTIATQPRQLLRSWYILFFQLPWLPQTLARLGNGRMLAASLRRSSRPGTFSDSDLDRYRHAWSQPGAVRSMINWYRAAIQKKVAVAGTGRIKIPTLVIWGVKDAFLLPEMAQASMKYCDNGKLVYLPEATHWVQHEEADRVNELLTQFWQTEPGH